jgi:hypothetical protein
MRRRLAVNMKNASETGTWAAAWRLAVAGIRTEKMSDLNDYRQYAQECVRWAAEATSHDDRQTFLEMAKAWTRIALVEHDVTKQIILDGPSGRLN